jgi:UDP-N-acetylglucosamine 2-epimerase
MKIAIIQGTRPEIIKNYSIVKALTELKVPFLVVHTNQHHLPTMRDDVYRDMAYEPDKVLPGDYRIGVAIDWIQSVLSDADITHVIVNGDTAASLAGAIAAMYLDIPVSHVEAGLRARDVHMIEERNRIMVDSIAQLLFAYTSYEEGVLAACADVRGRIYVEGNTTVDLIRDFAPRLQQKKTKSKFAYATLHRKELTDSPDRLLIAIRALRGIAREICPVLFAVHPRTRDAIERFGFRAELADIRCTQPHTIFESLSLQASATFLVTDSGCMQEESYILGTPCVTLRENTERHLTLVCGANRVTGFDHSAILASCEQALIQDASKWPEIYGAYGAGQRIVSRILKSETNLVARPRAAPRIVRSRAALGT